MEFNKKTAIFTVCNVAYLNKVMVLAESLYKSNKVKTEIFLFDKKREIFVNPDYCNIYWVEELDIPNFNILSFKYNIIELSTALKPWLALKLLESNSKVIFFDPDVMVFNSVDIIFNDLENYPVIVTPHYFYPKSNGLTDDEKIMRFGSYNLGFFAVNNSLQSRSFLNWWSEKCMLNCFDDSQFGIFTDQKWVTTAQCFFPFLHVSFNPSLNVAYWNLDERTITKNKKGQYIVNNEYPLIFFHFSSFNNNFPEKLSNNNFDIGINTNSVISELGLLYSEKSNEFCYMAYDTKYSFDYMSDQRYISPTLRRAYASVLNVFPENHDPFNSKGLVADFAEKNCLFQRNNIKHSVEGYRSVGNHTKKLKIIFILMRFILRIIGPNKFMNLSRLLVYLSSYQRVPEMWKT
jgi:hypothetical protein